MPYPLSSAVSAGDPTLASHYNNLRLDMLYLGMPATDAVKLGTLLERYESRLKIVRLNTTQLRIAATAAAPVGLLIAGYPVQAVANVDLAIGDAPAGPAANYYVFANRAGSSTTFTLSVSTSSVEGADQRRIGAFYWNGAAIEKDSIVTELAQQITDLIQFKESHVCEGRLTLSTGVPVPNSDIVSSSLVFFTPYGGNRVALYVPGYGWRHYTFSELSLDISAFGAATNYDIFLYDNAGVLTLSATAWSNATLRATSLSTQDGVLCKSGALNYRYLGTIRTFGAGTCRDTKRSRLIYNFYNRVMRPIVATEVGATASWTQAVAGTLYWNNNAANVIEILGGLDEDVVFLHFIQSVSHSGAQLTNVGFGVDSVIPTVSVGTRWFMANHGSVESVYFASPGLGFHNFFMLQYTAAATATFYGDYTSFTKSGAYGWIFA